MNGHLSDNEFENLINEGDLSWMRSTSRLYRPRRPRQRHART
ncbi:hypothetical protein BAY1663_03811 [Pseudomonas sp. BAY1663]|nr:hypothetical protein BAY1663_03811 [Pseudomonas sp. BAY1663]